MSFADVIRKKAASVPSIADLEERMLNQIYENHKRFILYQAERGERVMECSLNSSIDGIRLKSDSPLLKYDTYDNSISCKDLLYRKTKAGIFKDKTTFHLTVAGKMVVDYVTKKAKEDGLSVSFYVRYWIHETRIYGAEDNDSNIGETIKHTKNYDYIQCSLGAKYIV